MANERKQERVEEADGGQRGENGVLSRKRARNELWVGSAEQTLTN